MKEVIWRLRPSKIDPRFRSPLERTSPGISIHRVDVFCESDGHARPCRQ